MKIERPVENKDIVIVYDLVDDEELEILLNYWYAWYYHIGDQEPPGLEWNRDSIGFVPSKRNITIWRTKAEEILQLVKSRTFAVMQQEFPDLKLKKFRSYHKVSLRADNSFMPSHVDGPEDIDAIGHGIRGLGSTFYLTDSFLGGEISYPKLGYKFKPVAKSLVIHRADDTPDSDYRHGVDTVGHGWRLYYGMFAFEDYDPEEVMKRVEAERERMKYA